MKTVLITGASAGLGEACAQLFSEKGWRVLATVRNPQKNPKLLELAGTHVIQLDVTNEKSVQLAQEKAYGLTDQIDVLINNAGYALVGPFETASPEQIKNQFETNVFGLMRVTKAFLPRMREKKQGTIINITSVGGRISMPLNSLYHATKFAVEGFTESLSYELSPFGIKLRLIEPGGISSDFAGSAERIDDPTGAYGDIIQATLKTFESSRESGNYSTPRQIAEVVWESANNPSDRLRWVAGEDAKAMLAMRAGVSDEVYLETMKERFGLNS